METLRQPVGEVTLEPDAPAVADHLDLGWFSRQRVMRIVDVAVVLVVVGFVLGQLGLGNILTDNTPAGGDMGAHVWGPAFLRDHILPHFRLSGWTADWYDGFPAYQFYMVLPALMIVALNAGVHGLGGLLPLAVAIGTAVFAAAHFEPLQFPALFVFGLVAAVLATRTGRLGPGIWAHLAFNGFAVYSLLQ